VFGGSQAVSRRQHLWTGFAGCRWLSLVGLRWTPGTTSPFPEPYAACHKLSVCEYSLKYLGKKSTLLRRLAKLEARQPPGDQIYRWGWQGWPQGCLYVRVVRDISIPWLAPC